MTSTGAFGKSFFVAELKAEAEAVPAVREPCRTCAGALSVLKDGLIDSDLDLACNIDEGSISSLSSSSSEISMISASEGMGLDLER